MIVPTSLFCEKIKYISIHDVLRPVPGYGFQMSNVIIRDCRIFRNPVLKLLGRKHPFSAALEDRMYSLQVAPM